MNAGSLVATSYFDLQTAGLQLPGIGFDSNNQGGGVTALMTVGTVWAPPTPALAYLSGGVNGLPSISPPSSQMRFPASLLGRRPDPAC